MKEKLTILAYLILIGAATYTGIVFILGKAADLI